MDLAKLREALQHYLHRDPSPCAELDRLLSALARQSADLEQRLSQEQDPLQRRHLKIKLKVARLQHRKGIARRLKLQDDCP